MNSYNYLKLQIIIFASFVVISLKKLEKSQICHKMLKISKKTSLSEQMQYNKVKDKTNHYKTGGFHGKH
jgi:hypothetical protein